MNEGVLFVVHPILYNGTFPIWELFFAFLCSSICFFFYNKKLKPNKKSLKNINSTSNQIYIFPKISDNHFTEKSFLLLQKFVVNKYFPKKAFSHTKDDIKKYCTDTHIISLYEELEEIIFQNKKIYTPEKEKILQTLSNIINS